MPEVPIQVIDMLRDDIRNLRAEIREVKKEAKEDLEEAKREIVKKDAQIEKLSARVSILENVEAIQNWLSGAKKYVVWLILSGLSVAVGYLAIKGSKP